MSLECVLPTFSYRYIPGWVEQQAPRAAMALLTEFPIARSDSVMVIRGGQLMVWGGYTQTVIGEGDERFIVAINLPGE